MSLLLLVAKASVVLLSALGAAALLGRSAASTRHRLWSVAFALVLAVPALAFVLPALNVPMAAVQSEASTLEGHGGPWNSLSSLSKTIEPITSPILLNEIINTNLETPHGSPWPSKVDALIAIWATGVFVALATLSLSLFRVRRLSRDSEERMDDAWQSSASAISARFGLPAAPRLVVSARVSSPMAGGISRPTVFLPINARTWDAERRDVVLTHEIAHLASRDPLRHVVVRLAVACYWFHPLAWLAAHRATVSREQACDEAVLAAGTRPSTYARVLLELAESLGSGGAPLTALPMAQRSNLEKRLMAILNNDVRPSSTRASLAVVACLAVVTLSVAAARPSAAITADVVKLDNVGSLPAQADSLAERQAANQAPASTGLTDACKWNGNDRGFAGTTWSTDAGVTMRVVRSESQAIVQRSFDGLRVCMVAEGLADRVERPAQMMDRGTRVLLSSERDGQTQQMEVTRANGSARTTWRVNGKDRQIDAAAEEWRRTMLAVLDNMWETSQIRGQVSSLRGEISSIHGNESSLRGEISSISGQVSSLNGEISSIRAHESSLRGEISAIQGRLSSLRGEISSEQGAISSLSGARYDASAAEERRLLASIDGHRKQIEAIERQIAAFNAEGKMREVQKAMDSYNADGQVRELQKKIEAFAAEQKVNAVERQIEGLNVSDRVREIQKQIESLNADGRVQALEAQQADLVKRLRAAIAAIR